jgi:DNA-binding PadR family transcriptional regulator
MLTNLIMLGIIPSSTRQLRVRTLLISKELVAASSRPMVLSILTHGESYGYAIIQRVREASGGKIEWSEGMLYPVLHRLENEGLVLSRWRTAESGRRRKYYRLSSAGKRSLVDHRKQWLSVHETLAGLWGAELCPS